MRKIRLKQGRSSSIYRSQILEGKASIFLPLCILKIPVSASSGGELGFKMRGELEKPYADAAFSLTKNTVSKIVETRYGFHIIQLIDRNGDLINTRHILIKPKVKPRSGCKRNVEARQHRKPDKERQH